MRTKPKQKGWEGRVKEVEVVVEGRGVFLKTDNIKTYLCGHVLQEECPWEYEKGWDPWQWNGWLFQKKKRDTSPTVIKGKDLLCLSAYCYRWNIYTPTITTHAFEHYSGTLSSLLLHLFSVSNESLHYFFHMKGNNNKPLDPILFLFSALCSKTVQNTSPTRDKEAGVHRA